MFILSYYIIRQFVSVFFLCLFGVLIIYLVIDGVENMDGFLDAKTPAFVIVQYYLYYIPLIIVLILPACSLLASIFSVGTFARNNETVAMKALGISLYQVMRILLILGLLISIITFLLAEIVVVNTNRKMDAISEEYLEKGKSRSRTSLVALEIQEPPNKVVTIGRYNLLNQTATQVKIETFEDNRLVSQIFAPKMTWKDSAWRMTSGYKRDFTENTESVISIRDEESIALNFTPRELVIAQSKPEELNIIELKRFIQRILDTGQEVHNWTTDFHMRIAFPLGSFFIVLLAAPLVYNRRKQSLSIGFGLALVIVFFYFGLVKLGQTIGKNGSVDPFLGAWLGNGVAALTGALNLIRIRK